LENYEALLALISGYGSQNCVLQSRTAEFSARRMEKEIPLILIADFDPR
jgi:hypothetical protein